MDSKPLNRIIQGDALAELKKLPDGSVNCWVTSPPYWALRNYNNMPGQYGMEGTPEAYVMNMVDVFAEARRVLTDDGTLWLNLGDTYIGGKGANGASVAYSRHANCINKKALVNTAPGEFRPNDRPHPYLKPKDLVGIPWRVAFALQTDGWFLRQDIIWSKPNPMPEPTKDRCVKAHEYIFLLSKSRKYYFDYESIQEPAVYTDIAGLDGTGFKDPVRFNGKHSKAGMLRNRKQYKYLDTGKRNKRSVWECPTEPYPGSHYATFPRHLMEDAIKAGCPPGGVVGDMFFGTGTTGDVAHGQGKYFLGIDLDPESIRQAKERLQKRGGLFL
jgi:DNA modification methylase